MHRVSSGWQNCVISKHHFTTLLIVNPYLSQIKKSTQTQFSNKPYIHKYQFVFNSPFAHALVIKIYMTWTCWYYRPCCVIDQNQIFYNYKRGMDRKQKTETHDSKQQQAAQATYQPSPLSCPTQAIQKSLSCNENKAQKLICNKTLNRKTQRKKDCFYQKLSTFELFWYHRDATQHQTPLA